ncbi:MAG: MOFRL family protein, partial [Acidobacteriota bacterium]
VTIEEQLEGDVEEVARSLARSASRLRAGELLVAGGEATVVLHGDGRGGRCSELALRFARAAADSELAALFGSSDGVDGRSGAAGIYLPRLPRSLDLPAIDRALERSDSFPLAASLGEPIIIPPTGNNLRDLILVECIG